MSQLQNIEAIEKRLWSAADLLRANSGLASNEYFMPVMGLIFLRHAYSRYLAVKPQIESGLPSRGGKVRALTKEDFSQQGAIYLHPEAQFDHLVSLPDSSDRAAAIYAAMESIESDYAALRGVLPKAEYQKIANDDLGGLLRKLNPEELKTANGDIFGRIYEYFLTQFADQGAHQMDRIDPEPGRRLLDLPAQFAVGSNQVADLPVFALETAICCPRARNSTGGNGRLLRITVSRRHLHRRRQRLSLQQNTCCKKHCKKPGKA